MVIRLLDTPDLNQFRDLRLKALTAHPSSFGAAPEDEMNFTETQWISRIEQNFDQGSFIIGAWDNDKLVGTVGLKRDNRIKLRHKGLIWGVYIEPEYRGSGLGESMFSKLLESAIQVPHLEILYLTVGAESFGARKLYDRLGFQCFGNEPAAIKVNDRLIAEDWMWRTIDNSPPFHFPLINPRMSIL